MTILNPLRISKIITLVKAHYASKGGESFGSTQGWTIFLVVNLLKFHQIYKITLHMFASYRRKRLFNRKIKKLGLWSNLRELITFLAKVITFLCSLLDDYFVTFLAIRYYISMQLFYYISMQVLLHFYAGITFLCKVITFLCRLLHF